MSHWENRRLVTDWRPTPWDVHGGFAVRMARWVRTENGWDHEDQIIAQPEAVYRTETEACLVAARIPQ